MGGPAAPPLFTFFLWRGQRAGPARESPERQVGEVGGDGPKALLRGREGAKELGVLCGLPPPLHCSGGASQRASLQGNRRADLLFYQLPAQAQPTMA